ncbi:phosphopantetheine-binding protein [Kitasatospora sp. NPDC056327]|uniref:phosphopantetheine-binding protein n=1 Tax=Kitasatospora sp. NPDC056327 TaxID=3345785 RepID=UPI0035E17C7F
MPDPAPTRHLALEEIRQDIAYVLDVEPAEVDLDEYLPYQGLDSLRVMQLVQRWREGGVEVTFVDLAERLTARSWWEFLRG